MNCSYKCAIAPRQGGRNGPCFSERKKAPAGFGWRCFRYVLKLDQTVAWHDNKRKSISPIQKVPLRMYTSGPEQDRSF